MGIRMRKKKGLRQKVASGLVESFTGLELRIVPMGFKGKASLRAVQGERRRRN